jgi:hypothetical protein
MEAQEIEPAMQPTAAPHRRKNQHKYKNHHGIQKNLDSPKDNSSNDSNADNPTAQLITSSEKNKPDFDANHNKIANVARVDDDSERNSKRRKRHTVAKTEATKNMKQDLSAEEGTDSLSQEPVVEIIDEIDFPQERELERAANSFRKIERTLEQLATTTTVYNTSFAKSKKRIGWWHKLIRKPTDTDEPI